MKMDTEELKENFTYHELRLIQNCIDYMQNEPEGLPHHELMDIIWRLVNDDAVEQALIEMRWQSNDC